MTETRRPPSSVRPLGRAVQSRDWFAGFGTSTLHRERVAVSGPGRLVRDQFDELRIGLTAGEFPPALDGDVEAHEHDLDLDGEGRLAPDRRGPVLFQVGEL